MSLPRSIDRADLGGATVVLTTTAETVVLIGPALQTPKDTSFVIFLALVQVLTGASTTGVTLRVRMGNTIAGAVVGQAVTQGGLTSPVNTVIPITVSLAANFTDYVQLTLTAQQVAATANGTVQSASALSISF